MYSVASKTHAKVRDEFLSILSSLGGTMEFEQAKKTLSILDSNSCPYEFYRAENYLKQDFKSKFLMADHDTCLISIGRKQTMNTASFDNNVLLGYSCILDFVEDADDLLSVAVRPNSHNALEFVFDGERQYLIHTNKYTIDSVFSQIMSKEAALAETFSNVELVRPKYWILICESESDIITECIERVNRAGFKFPYQFVTMSGNLERYSPKFTYLNP